MLGAAINIIPFMLHRSVPGIGPYVLPAYLFAALPAVFAAISYAILASAMPRAGGSYIFASRSLNPYLGFIASFAQWFGLSIAIGVVSYVIVPFLRDIAEAVGWVGVAETLEIGWVRVGLSLLMLWGFVAVNIRGNTLYQKTLIPLMFLMFVLGSVVIVAGFSFDQQSFVDALQARDGVAISLSGDSVSFDWRLFWRPPRFCFLVSLDSIRSPRPAARPGTRAGIYRWPSGLPSSQSALFIFSLRQLYTIPCPGNM